MKIAELQAKQGNVEIEGTVVKLEDVREWSKGGAGGKVRNGFLKDDSGEIKITLWNEQADQVQEGAKIKISNGYVSEWQGEKQLSTGKFGSLEVLEPGQEPAQAEPVQEQVPEPSPEEDDKPFIDEETIQ